MTLFMVAHTQPNVHGIKFFSFCFKDVFIFIVYVLVF